MEYLLRARRTFKVRGRLRDTYGLEAAAAGVKKQDDTLSLVSRRIK